MVLICKRASGELKTTAYFIREFVQKHPAYRQDSVISEAIAYDLVMELKAIGEVLGNRNWEAFKWGDPFLPFTPEFVMMMVKVIVMVMRMRMTMSCSSRNWERNWEIYIFSLVGISELLQFQNFWYEWSPSYESVILRRAILSAVLVMSVSP